MVTKVRHIYTLYLPSLDLEGFDSHEMAFFQMLTKAQSLPLNYSVVLKSDVETTESLKHLSLLMEDRFILSGPLVFPYRCT